MKAKISKIAWLTTFLGLFFLILCVNPSVTMGQINSAAATFLLVVSKQSGPYLMCEEGVKKAIRHGWKGPYKIYTIYLNNDEIDELKEKVERLKPTAAILIGTRAAFFMKELHPSYPWVATFLLKKSIQQLNVKRLLAITMDVPLEKKLNILCMIKNNIRAGLLEPNQKHSVQTKFDEDSCRGRNAYLVVAPYSSSIENALNNILKLSINSFFITPEPEIFSSQEAVTYTLLWGLRNKIAICGLSSGYVKNGALFALEADIPDLGRQAAELMMDYLAGKIKEEKIIKHPRKLVLSLNLRTARRLGVKVPDSVIDMAQIIIR
ncbi:MAG: hypothetical protein GXO58_05705 [Thermodesulfobacteria bacterium]|nr:hypothetical protein [Thermodesulfobacteriota bacterium]